MTQEPAHAARRAARLAAVQALYQMELSGDSAEGAVEDLLAGRLPQSEAGPIDADVDVALFRALVEGAVEEQAAIDTMIAKSLAAGWRLDRIDSVARAILRAAVVELARRRDIPAPVVIDEYVEVAKAYFDGPEPGFINGALDACARSLRGAARG